MLREVERKAPTARLAPCRVRFAHDENALARGIEDRLSQSRPERCAAVVRLTVAAEAVDAVSRTHLTPISAVHHSRNANELQSSSTFEPHAMT